MAQGYGLPAPPEPPVEVPLPPPDPPEPPPDPPPPPPTPPPPPIPPAPPDPPPPPLPPPPDPPPPDPNPPPQPPPPDPPPLPPPNPPPPPPPPPPPVPDPPPPPDPYPTPRYTTDLTIRYSDYANVGAILTRAGLNNYVSTDLLSLDTTINYGGYLTLRNTFPAGSSLHGAEIEWYLPNSSAVVPVHSFWARSWRRFSPGFTTAGLGSGAQALKVMGWGWSGADNRGTLDLTNGNQYQLSAGANVGATFVIPFVNSFDVAQGHQLWTVQNEWTDGLWYQYVIQVRYDAAGIRAQAYIFKDGTMPTGPVLHITAPTIGGAPPLTNRVQSMFYMNETPMAVTLYENEAGVECSLDVNPWSLPSPLT